MNCAACGGSSRVTTSRPVISIEGGRCRYRTCCHCGHRWVSWQAPEQLLPAHAVRWMASDVAIDGDVLRRMKDKRLSPNR